MSLGVAICIRYMLHGHISSRSSDFATRIISRPAGAAWFPPKAPDLQQSPIPAPRTTKKHRRAADISIPYRPPAGAPSPSSLARISGVPPHPPREAPVRPQA
jgi:hypothetical protein